MLVRLRSVHRTVPPGPYGNDVFHTFPTGVHAHGPYCVVTVDTTVSTPHAVWSVRIGIQISTSALGYLRLK